LEFGPFHPDPRVGATKEPKFEQRRIRPEGSVNRKKVACVLRQVELEGARQKGTSVPESRGKSRKGRKAGNVLQAVGAYRKTCNGKVCPESASSAKRTLGKSNGQPESRAVTRLPES